MSPPDLAIENSIWAKGKMPAGVDEAGRGPLAGPVVASCVVLPEGCEIRGLNDSKKLSHNQRKKILTEITNKSVAFSIGIVEPPEIDRINILRAALLAMEISVQNIRSDRPDYLLIDGNQRTSLPMPQETVVKGDSKCASIAAASVIAKVIRDYIMEKYHYMYPEYNFIKHKGYPTKEHYEALRQYGPCPIHRRSFNGVI